MKELVALDPETRQKFRVEEQKMRKGGKKIRKGREEKRAVFCMESVLRSLAVDADSIVNSFISRGLMNSEDEWKDPESGESSCRTSE